MLTIGQESALPGALPPTDTPQPSREEPFANLLDWALGTADAPPAEEHVGSQAETGSGAPPAAAFTLPVVFTQGLLTGAALPVVALERTTGPLAHPPSPPRAAPFTSEPAAPAAEPLAPPSSEEEARDRDGSSLSLMTVVPLPAALLVDPEAPSPFDALPGNGSLRPAAAPVTPTGRGHLRLLVLDPAPEAPHGSPSDTASVDASAMKVSLAPPPWVMRLEATLAELDALRGAIQPAAPTEEGAAAAALPGVAVDTSAPAASQTQWPGLPPAVPAPEGDGNAAGSPTAAFGELPQGNQGAAMRGTPALALGASPDVASRPPASFPEAAGPLPAAEGAVSSLEQDWEAPSGSHAAGAPGTTPAASAPATELGSTTVVPAAAPPVASEVSPAETRAPEPAPGNPTSAPLDPGGPVEQIAAATRLHLRGRGAGTLEMHLEPAALGRLRLQVTLQEGSLAAYLGTESHAAQQLLMDQAPALRAALQESGLPVETVQIGLELGFATTGNSQRQPKWHPAPAAVATNKLPAPPAPALVARTPAAVAGLDYLA